MQRWLIRSTIYSSSKSILLKNISRSRNVINSFIICNLYFWSIGKLSYLTHHLKFLCVISRTLSHLVIILCFSASSVSVLKFDPVMLFRLCCVLWKMSLVIRLLLYFAFLKNPIWFDLICVSMCVPAKGSIQYLCVSLGTPHIKRIELLKLVLMC